MPRSPPWTDFYQIWNKRSSHGHNQSWQIVFRFYRGWKFPFFPIGNWRCRYNSFVLPRSLCHGITLVCKHQLSFLFWIGYNLTNFSPKFSIKFHWATLYSYMYVGTQISSSVKIMHLFFTVFKYFVTGVLTYLHTDWFLLVQIRHCIWHRRMMMMLNHTALEMDRLWQALRQLRNENMMLRTWRRYSTTWTHIHTHTLPWVNCPSVSVWSILS